MRVITTRQYDSKPTQIELTAVTKEDRLLLNALFSAIRGGGGVDVVTPSGNCSVHFGEVKKL